MSISITLVVDTGKAVLVRPACGFASLHSHFIPGGTIYDVIESLFMIPGPGLRCWLSRRRAGNVLVASQERFGVFNVFSGIRHTTTVTIISIFESAPSNLGFVIGCFLGV